jgi:hypothetical protein
VVIAVQAVAFRFAYVALPAWFVLLGGLARVPRWRPLGVVLLLGVVFLNGWFLHELVGVTDPGLLVLESAG